ncbi:hypothetical protein [Campylobacter ureolyticus]|uniref:hypothetical protein n=1 Tax=Campylobacter ureolyticus TaxID=827 RepID=UPI0022B50941|nr:hypothetical protein [Campylobacter ureolyticus]MCZ6132298.1 hypothetical protein [Campylobacter ureolyticus]
MLYGQINKVEILYLYNYTNEIAYREDTKRWDNEKIVNDILQKCLKDHHSISNEFTGC